MKERLPVIITGMHRSGTSMTANVLQQAGVNIGEELLGAWKGNPRGHFEDMGFLQFHEALLRHRDLSFFVESTPHLQAATTEELNKAQALIDERQGRGLWGWKEPRTTLFLDLWNELLPQACFVFVYRHPIDVVLSLLRRATDSQALASPFLALRVWHVYNRAILDFSKKHPERCLLCHVTHLAEDLSAFSALLATRFGLNLNFETAKNIYSPDLLQQNPCVADRRVHSVLQMIAPQIPRLYSELESIANLPSQAAFEPSESTCGMLSEFVLFAEEVTRSTHLGISTQAPLFSLLLCLIAPEVMKDRPQASLEMIERILKERDDFADLHQEMAQTFKETTEHMERLSHGNERLTAAFEESNHRAETLQALHQEKQVTLQDLHNKTQLLELEFEQHQNKARALQAESQEQQRALEAEIQALSAELREDKQRIATHQAVTLELDHKKVEVATLESNIENQRTHILGLEGDLRAKDVQLADKEAQLANQSATLKVIYGSRSWRLVESYWKASNRVRRFLGFRDAGT